MAITNNMIILMESFRLMDEGILKGSGIINEVEINGETKKMEMPEEIHTYNRWKQLGYQVQKGEKSKIKFNVWHYRTGRRGTEADGEENVENRGGKCYMQLTAFFTMDQVKRIEA